MTLDRKLTAADVLTISATEWAEMTGERLSDYNIQGIHKEGFGNSHPPTKLADSAPIGSKVIVRYSVTSLGGISYYASGIALVRKNDSPE